MGEENVGVVKWFNNNKGFGFINEDGVDEDIFVHFSSIEMKGYKTLREGEKVSYSLITGKDGKLQAEDVVVVGIPE